MRTRPQSLKQRDNDDELTFDKLGKGFKQDMMTIDWLIDSPPLWIVNLYLKATSSRLKYDSTN
jgi:hypothetical protein